LEKVKQEVAKAEDALKEKLAEAQVEYQKIKQELKDELKKLEDEFQHVIHKRSIIGDLIKEIKDKIDDVVHKIQSDLNAKFAQAKEEIRKIEKFG